MMEDTQIVGRIAREEAQGHGLRLTAIIDTTSVSGPGRQLAAMMDRLTALGVDGRVVTFHRAGRSRSPYLDYLERAGVQCTVLEERGRFDVRLILRLRRLLDDWAPDVVQTHGYKPTVLAHVLRRSGARWAWVAFFHGATSENATVRFYHFLDTRLLGRADRVVVMSREQAARFARLGSKVSIIYNAALDLQDCGTDMRRNASAVAGTTPCVGVVGRLSPEKGVDVFLHACRELTDRGRTFRALVVGDGPERTRLEELCTTLRLGHQVQFLGAVSAMPTLYAALQLLVIPSRSEGLPNVLLEALSADVPVVATRVGAIPDVLEGTGAGALVTPESPRALADAIETSILTPCDQLARRARRTVVERFSVQRRAMEHLRLYTELCPSRSGGQASAPVVSVH